MTAFHRVLDPAGGIQVKPGLCALAVMTKAPRAGKVKTRLTPPLRPEEAAALNTCFLRDIAITLAANSHDGSSRGVAVYTPVGAEDAYAGILPPEFELMPQRGDAFGERLTYAMQDLFAVGFESACLINSDSPNAPQRAFAEAAQVLSRPGERVVIGPSDDGGYYLIGLKKLHHRLFAEIDWSTEKVLEQTLSRAAEINLDVHQLQTWYDVDDRMTLRRLCQELLSSDGGPGDAAPAPETKKFLSDILEREGRDRIWPNE